MQSVVSLMQTQAGIVSLIPVRPILSSRLIMKKFLQSFPTCADSRRAVVSYKVCAQSTV